MSKLSVEDRFWSKVDKTEGCWVWTASKYPTGYGQFWDGSKNTTSHRWVYENTKGKIPKGLVVDHMCRNRACVNPGHLRLVTPRENSLSWTSQSPAAKAARQAWSEGELITRVEQEILDEAEAWMNPDYELDPDLV